MKTQNDMQWIEQCFTSPPNDMQNSELIMLELNTT